MPNAEKNAKKRIKQYINEKLSSTSAGNFTILIFVGIGLGFILSVFNTVESFIISYTFLITCIVIPFVIYIIPKFIGVFKKEKTPPPPSFYLARGINGETPKVKKSSKPTLITIDL